jgi:sulfide:quinone oxidoreductase
MLKNLTKISFKYSQHTKYCIIGGGTGGLNTAAHLLRSEVRAEEIRLFEPSEYHYYQPGWTMIGNNLTDPENTRKPMRDVLPENIHWNK